jgi:predicted ATPase
VGAPREAAVEGRGSMALIGGPAGMGKSRLARETVALAEQLGVSVLIGHCVDMESPPPYQPIIEQAARAASADGFRATLGVNAPEVAKLLPSLRQRYDDIPPSPELTPAVLDAEAAKRPAGAGVASGKGSGGSGKGSAFGSGIGPAAVAAGLVS